MPLISLVIPAHNEAESLLELLRNITAVLKADGYTAEVIFINDGSTDATADILYRYSPQRAGLFGELLVAFLIHKGKE